MRTFHRRRAFGGFRWTRPAPTPLTTIAIGGVTIDVETTAPAWVAPLVVPETPPTPAALTLVGVLQGRHRRAARLLVLEGDLETVIAEIGPGELPGSSLLDGKVLLTRLHQLRRSASVAVANAAGVYTPNDSSSLIWPSRIVRLERGAYVAGVPQYAELLTGLIGARPRVDPVRGMVSFPVVSRMQLLDRPFPQPITFPVGTRLNTLVRTVCELGGMGISEALYDLDDGGAVVRLERPFDTNEQMLASLITYVHDQGVDGPYDDGHGRVTMRPFTDPTTIAAAFTFREGTAAIITALEWEVSAPPVAYNRQQVVAIGADRYPIVGEWRDLNPQSPTYNPPDGSGPLGDLPARPYMSTEIHSQRAANAVAQKVGIERALTSRTAVGRMAPFPLLDAARGDVMAFEDVAGVTERLWLQQAGIPLGDGDMDFEATMLREVGAAV